MVAASVALVAAPAAANAAGDAAARAQAASNRCPDAATPPRALALAEAQAAMLCLINAQRTARGLRSLRSHPSLAKVASAFARLMAEQRFLDHTSPDGSTLVSRIKATRYLGGSSSWTLGENIAWVSAGRSTPRATVEAWMNSPPHRANLLASRFTDVGIGLAAGGGTAEINPNGVGTTYVTDFGHRTTLGRVAKRRP
jgi:uncharacterized protein YkwD